MTDDHCLAVREGHLICASAFGMLGYKVITGLMAMASPEWAQSNSNLDAFVNVFSWFTAYGQASSSDAMAQGAANLNAVQQESNAWIDSVILIVRRAVTIYGMSKLTTYVNCDSDEEPPNMVGDVSECTGNGTASAAASNVSVEHTSTFAGHGEDGDESDPQNNDFLWTDDSGDSDNE